MSLGRTGENLLLFSATKGPSASRIGLCLMEMWEGKVRAKALGGLCYSYYGPDMTESTLFLFFVVEV